MLDLLIRDYNRELALYYVQKRYSYPHWNDYVLLPLIRAIGMELNMGYEVSGPYGLRPTCFISVDGGNSSYILAVTPHYNESMLDWFYYDTGEDTRPWDANGFGMKTERLPNCVSEIIAIMKQKAKSFG